MDVYVTPMRYLLGLSDLTGELMRFAINAVASIAPLQIMEHVLTMQRTIFHGTFYLYGSSQRWNRSRLITQRSGKNSKSH